MKVTKEVRLLLKIVVTLVVIGYLAWAFYKQKTHYYQLLNQVVAPENLLPFLFLLFLMLLNWGLEAVKWQELASKEESIGFTSALKAVFVGISLGIVTPKSIGECIGRFLLLKSFKKYRLLGSLLLGQSFQMAATLLFGVPAAWYYVSKVNGDFKLSFIAGAVTFLITITVLTFRKELLTLIFQTTIGQRIKRYLVVVKEYTKYELIKIAVLSILRYLTFSFQFIIVLWLLHAQASFAELFMLVSVVYLVKSLLFSVNFVADMGMRQLTAVTVMGLAGISESSATLASFGVWLINILIPALIGLFIWTQLKLKW